MACITPVTSHLLRRQERWRPRKYTNNAVPQVFDLSANVSGPSEGFSQAGCFIQAALGFDENRTINWKIRHHAGQIYDSSPEAVIDDFVSGKLQLPASPNPDPPKIIVVASEHSCFRVNESNKSIPSIEDFQYPLATTEAAISALTLDFLVMLMPPAILHSSSVCRFASTIIRILEKRMSVHIKLIPLTEYGLPQHRGILAIVASPFCAALPWQVDDWLENSVEPEVRITDLIGDLEFVNPRAADNSNVGFVCCQPTEDDPGASTSVTKYIYNHQTGRTSTDTIATPSIDGVLPLFRGPTPYIHPTRRDLFTVREIARTQGIPDDFVFYGTEAAQYGDVCRAIPPIVSKRVAQALLYVIRNSLVMRVEDTEVPLRISKRPRLEDASGGE